MSASPTITTASRTAGLVALRTLAATDARTAPLLARGLPRIALT